MTVNRRWLGHIPEVLGLMHELGADKRWLDPGFVKQHWKKSLKNTSGQLAICAREGLLEEHMGKYRIVVEGVDGSTLEGYVSLEHAANVSAENGCK